MEGKTVTLGVDWLPDATPQFIVFLRSDAVWDDPAGEPIGPADLARLRDLIPRQLKAQDNVVAEVDFLEV